MKQKLSLKIAGEAYGNHIYMTGASTAAYSARRGANVYDRKHKPWVGQLVNLRNTYRGLKIHNLDPQPVRLSMTPIGGGMLLCNIPCIGRLRDSVYGRVAPTSKQVMRFYAVTNKVRALPGAMEDTTFLLSIGAIS